MPKYDFNKVAVIAFLFLTLIAPGRGWGGHNVPRLLVFYPVS